MMYTLYITIYYKYVSKNKIWKGTMDGLILMSKDEYLYYYYMYLSSRKLVPLRTVNSKVYKRR